MPVLVQKYGGTSVDGPERIRAVAARIARSRAAGHALVVVVSAMGQTTDELLRLAHEVSPAPDRRELDMLLTTGERVAMALLAMALRDAGVPAISFTGSQSGILTDAAHAAARITAVRPERIRAALERGQVAIVAGFQGVNPESRDITTLGRGGSDTTAVALAASLAAGRCEILTDVPGVLTADPRVVPGARVVPRMGYTACSTLAHLGGRVLHARCVDLAARERVPLAVRSSFDDSPGTVIEEDGAMADTAGTAGTHATAAPLERARVQAIALRGECSVVIAEGNAGARGEARGIIEAAAAAFPELELLAHEQVSDEHGVLAWVGSRADAERFVREFRTLRGPGGEWRAEAQHGAAFVS
ncbi:MAG TPA: aspartate kinase, partial [Candidatus Eisenbacteria bacterium]|nr:aspartate kinase [Candidatus Eisenbacteria bacterium]